METRRTGALVTWAAVSLLCGAPAELKAKRRPPPARHLLSDAEVRKTIINTSIAIHPGDCACPYNVTARGKYCGRRSAWSRHGDSNVTCYPNEISAGELREWRARHRQINLPTGRFRSMEQDAGQKAVTVDVPGSARMRGPSTETRHRD